MRGGEEEERRRRRGRKEEETRHRRRRRTGGRRRGEERAPWRAASGRPRLVAHVDPPRVLHRLRQLQQRRAAC